MSHRDGEKQQIACLSVWSHEEKKATSKRQPHLGAWESVTLKIRVYFLKFYAELGIGDFDRRFPLLKSSAAFIAVSERLQH